MPLITYIHSTTLLNLGHVIQAIVQKQEIGRTLKRLEEVGGSDYRTDKIRASILIISRNIND